MELLNAVTSMELNSYQKANAWWTTKMSEYENSAYKDS